jgi:hypothetical protein
MKFSWTGVDKGDLIYRWLLNRGDHMGKFDRTLFIKVVNVLVIYRNIKAWFIGDMEIVYTNVSNLYSISQYWSVGSWYLKENRYNVLIKLRKKLVNGVS